MCLHRDFVSFIISTHIITEDRSRKGEMSVYHNHIQNRLNRSEKVCVKIRPFTLQRSVLFFSVLKEYLQS